MRSHLGDTAKPRHPAGSVPSATPECSQLSWHCSFPDLLLLDIPISMETRHHLRRASLRTAQCPLLPGSSEPHIPDLRAQLLQLIISGKGAKQAEKASTGANCGRSACSDARGLRSISLQLLLPQPCFPRSCQAGTALPGPGTGAGTPGCASGMEQPGHGDAERVETPRRGTTKPPGLAHSVGTVKSRGPARRDSSA